MNPGSLLIQLSALLTLVAFVAAVRWARGRGASERTFRLAYYGLTACLGLASVLLMVAILRHDFRFDYVVGYSSRDLPLLYLISAFWAGQQGTFLLWALMSAVIGLFLCRQKSWQPAWVMAAYTPTVGFLITLMLDPGGNPFKLAARVLPDGRGLNPLLQDPWMASHPPTVFLGYAALTVPAVMALVAAIKRDDSKWLAPALRWSLVGFITLGVGIILGGFWAYKVLGWGGYWGWDPVENASLIPWITVTALIHGLLVQKATGSLRRSNLALALGCYLLVVYATFLTRSGVLADFSVHSFPAGTLYRLLVGVMLAALAVSVWAVARRWRGQSPAVPMSLGWPMVLSSAILILALSGVLVAVATSWPIISPWLVGNAASIATPFYNRVNLPLFTIVFALLVMAPLLTWGGAPAGWARRLLAPGATAAAVTVWALSLGVPVTWALPLFFLAVFALGTSAIRLVQVGRQNLLHIGAPMAHIGFALMFVGIVGSGSWSVDETVRLPLNEPVQTIGTTVVYRGMVPGSAPEFRWHLGVMNGSGEEVVKEATLYRTDEQGEEASFMRKPAIFRRLARDLYLIPTGVEEASRDGHDLVLPKGEAVDMHGTVLTFTGFEMGQAEGEQHSMVVYGLVEVRVGEASEAIRLPFTASDAGGFAGQPVPAPLAEGLVLTMQAMSVEQGMIKVRADEGGGAGGKPETMVLQASSEPLMSVLWLGTLLLCLGCVVAGVRRFREAGLQLVHDTGQASKRRSAA